MIILKFTENQLFTLYLENIISVTIQGEAFLELIIVLQTRIDFHWFFCEGFSMIIQDRHCTKHYVSNFIFLLLVLSFEDHFRFIMLYLSKYLKINRVKTFDLNIVKKKKIQSKVSKIDFGTLSLVIVLWLIQQSFGRFFPTKSHLHPYFSESLLLNSLGGFWFSGFIYAS